MAMREDKVKAYFNALDWDAMSDEIELVNRMELMLALTQDRVKTMELFRFLAMHLEGSGKVEPGILNETRIREYDDIMGDVNRHTGNVPTPWEPAPEDSNEPVEDEGNTGHVDETINGGVDESINSGVPLVNAPTGTGLAEFNLTFDESNESDGDTDGEDNSNVVINRRGTGEPILGGVEFVSNEEDTDGENRPPELVNLPNIPRPQRDVILGKDVEDADKAHIHQNPVMMSYFSLLPVGESTQGGRDTQGNFPVNYSVSIIISEEYVSEDADAGDLWENEVLAVASMEHAITTLNEGGFMYNSTKNVFSKVNASGKRTYARVVLDVDLRGALG